MRTFDQNVSPGRMKECAKTQTCEAQQIDEPFKVETMEGTMEGKAGDYLMRGVQGELYVCDQSVFDESYEFVEQGDAPDDYTRLKKYLTDWRMRALEMNDDPEAHDELLDHIHRQDESLSSPPEGAMNDESEPYLDIRRVGRHLAFEGYRVPLEDVNSWVREDNVVLVWFQGPQDMHMNSVTKAYDLQSDARRAIKLIDDAMSPTYPSTKDLEPRVEWPFMGDKEPKTAAKMADQARHDLGDFISPRVSASNDPMKPLTIMVDVDGLENGVISEVVEHLMHHFDLVVRDEGIFYAYDYDALEFRQHALRGLVE